MIIYELEEKPRSATAGIIVDGEKIGTVWPMEYGFQCQIHFGPLTKCGGHQSMNGIDCTKIKAIQAAIKNARKQGHALMEAAYWLEERI